MPSSQDGQIGVECARMAKHVGMTTRWLMPTKVGKRESIGGGMQCPYCNKISQDFSSIIARSLQPKAPSLGDRFSQSPADDRPKAREQAEQADHHHEK